MIIYVMLKFVKRVYAMKRILFLLSLLLIIPLYVTSSELVSLQGQLTQKEQEFKTLQDDMNLYNLSYPKIKAAENIIATQESIISNRTLKLQDLTGIETAPNGIVTYNNKSGSNDVLTKANTTLQNDLSNAQTQYNSLSATIETARDNLGKLRSSLATVGSDATATASINTNIKFYQDKITKEYIPQRDEQQKIILDSQSKISQNTNIINQNTSQINLYKTEIDNAHKLINDNKAIIADLTSKLEQTQHKISFQNATMMNNKLTGLANEINYLKSRILMLQQAAKTTK